MKGKFRFSEVVFAAVLGLRLCVAAFAQEKDLQFDTGQKSPLTDKTGVGTGSEGTTTTKPGRADGLGNPMLGGERHPLYRLCKSDVVEVSFTVVPEFSQTLRVQPDGYITLKDAGLVYAEGLTVPELAEAIRHAYQGQLHDPEVAVTLQDFDRPYFLAGGEVGRPGKYELRRDTTVTEAITMAGGFTRQAKHSQVVLFRRVNNELVEARVLDLKRMLRNRELGEDLHLRAGDMVFVPQNSLSKIERFLPRSDLGLYVNPFQF